MKHLHLIQEGYFALHEAVKHYNPAASVPFANYLAIWIRQVMGRYVENNGNTVRIPVHAKQCVNQYKRYKANYWKEYGRYPEDIEVCRGMYWSQRELDSVKRNEVVEQIQSIDKMLERR